MIARNHGRFVWYELLTTNARAATSFYSDVIGWQPQQVTELGDYTMWVAEQGPVGGVTVLPESAKQLGASPFWQANIEVADVDEAVAKVTQLGGKVYVTEDVPGIGRLAVIADPQGAVIAVFTPSRDMPAHDTARPGEISWHELYTTDHEAAFRASITRSPAGNGSARSTWARWAPTCCGVAVASSSAGC